MRRPHTIHGRRMLTPFSLDTPQDTGDDRVTFLIRHGGTVLPGFVSRAALIAIGGLTSNNVVALYAEHRERIATAVRKKLAQQSSLQFIVLSLEDLM